MGQTDIRASREEELIWLALPRLETRSCAVPQWTAEVLGVEPVAAATCGRDQGYLVLAFAEDSDLGSIHTPDHSIARHTARAIIATCPVSKARARCDETVHLRYFAPQYGVAEDTATGSAMRVLAEYWRQCGLGDSQTALQRSHSGGYLMSRIQEDDCWIGGRVVSAHRKKQ